MVTLLSSQVPLALRPAASSWTALSPRSSLVHSARDKFFVTHAWLLLDTLGMRWYACLGNQLLRMAVQIVWYKTQSDWSDYLLLVHADGFHRNKTARRFGSAVHHKLTHTHTNSFLIGNSFPFTPSMHPWKYTLRKQCWRSNSWTSSKSHQPVSAGQSIATLPQVSRIFCAKRLASLNIFLDFFLLSWSFFSNSPPCR